MDIGNRAFNLAFIFGGLNLNTPKTLGERILFARKGILSQSELSKATGISQNSLSRYERNERIPKTDMANRICIALGVSPEWLFTGQGQMHPNMDASSGQMPRREGEICLRCQELEVELRQERHERRELSAENRQLYRDKERLMSEIAELKAEVATLNERLKAEGRGGTAEVSKTITSKTA